MNWAVGRFDNYRRVMRFTNFAFVNLYYRGVTPTAIIYHPYGVWLPNLNVLVFD